MLVMNPRRILDYEFHKLFPNQSLDLDLIEIFALKSLFKFIKINIFQYKKDWPLFYYLLFRLVEPTSDRHDLNRRAVFRQGAVEKED